MKITTRLQDRWNGSRAPLIYLSFGTVIGHIVVRAWLERNPRITLHFTPMSGSWLNMVEIFFGIITRHAIRRGTFRSVKDLTGAITRFIDGWNDRCEPFVWTKTADQILSHSRSQKTSFTRH